MGGSVGRAGNRIGKGSGVFFPGERLGELEGHFGNSIGGIFAIAKQKGDFCFALCF